MLYCTGMSLLLSFYFYGSVHLFKITGAICRRSIISLSLCMLFIVSTVAISCPTSLRCLCAWASQCAAVHFRPLWALFRWARCFSPTQITLFRLNSVSLKTFDHLHNPCFLKYNGGILKTSRGWTHLFCCTVKEQLAPNVSVYLSAWISRWRCVNCLSNALTLPHCLKKRRLTCLAMLIREPWLFK